MALSTETVNTVLSGLRGPLGLSFARRDPLWKALYLKNKVRQTTGSMIERSFTGAAPARGVGIMDGFELLDMTRPQNIRRFRVEPARLVVASNIPMYIVGAAHPHKLDSQRLLEESITRGEKLVTDCEVLQEILHRYAAIGRRNAIQPAFEALLGIVDEVFPIEFREVSKAREVVLGNEKISARDAIHIAVMERHGVGRILSFDAGFDGFPGIERIPR